MFEWLNEELSRVKWPKFHQVGMPLSVEVIAAIERASGSLPFGYRNFVSQFAFGRFFRDISSGTYALTIYGELSGGFETGDCEFFTLGICEGESIYLAKQKRSQRFLSEVLVQHRAGVRKGGEDFESWLRKVFTRLNRGISTDDKRALAIGPLPFSPEELGIIEARERYEVTKEGVDGYGNVLLRIGNWSAIQLEYLSVKLGTDRIRSLTPVPTRDIVPGSVAFIPVNFYKRYPQLVRPENVEVIPLEPIGPEDRGILFELGGPKWIQDARAAGRIVGSEKDLHS